MSPLNPATILLRRELPWRNVAGELVLLDQDGGVIMGLNRTGGTVWESLDGSRSLAEVASLLAERYGRDEAAVQSDVMAFARALLDRNLVAPR